MIPPELDCISVSQLGLLTTRQFNDHGFNAQGVDWLRRTGVVSHLRRGVVKLRGVPPLPEHPALAACLAAGPDAITASWTAVALTGLPGSSLAIPELHLTAPKRLRLSDVTYHEPPGILVPNTVRRNVPTLEVAYVIASLGGTAHVDLIQEMVDHALRNRMCTLAQLRAAVDELERSGRRQLGDVRIAIDRYVPGQEKTDNDLELRALREIAEAGFVPPVLQFRLTLPEGILEIDIAWPSVRTAVEVKGSKLYRQVAKWLRDDEKSNLYARYGWRAFTMHEATKPGVLTKRLDGIVPRLNQAA